MNLKGSQIGTIITMYPDPFDALLYAGAEGSWVV